MYVVCMYVNICTGMTIYFYQENIQVTPEAMPAPKEKLGMNFLCLIL